MQHYLKWSIKYTQLTKTIDIILMEFNYSEGFTARVVGGTTLKRRWWDDLYSVNQKINRAKVKLLAEWRVDSKVAKLVHRLCDANAEGRLVLSDGKTADFVDKVMKREEKVDRTLKVLRGGADKSTSVGDGQAPKPTR